MIAAADTPLINVLIRMVVPMRREFGLSIDVQQIRSDAAYARNVVQQALTSRVDRLREYAAFVDSHLQNQDVVEDGHTLPSTLAAASTAAPTATPAKVPSALNIRRVATQAARQLLDQVGPMGEPLAIQLERARDLESLRALVVRACELIASVRGRQLAQAYREQLPQALT